MKKFILLLGMFIMLNFTMARANHFYDLEVFDINQSSYVQRQPNANKTIEVKTYYVRGGNLPYYKIEEAMWIELHDHDSSFIGFNFEPSIIGSGQPQKMTEFLNALKSIDNNILNQLQAAKQRVDTERHSYWPYPYKWYGFNATFTVKLDRWYDTFEQETAITKNKITQVQGIYPVNNCTFDYNVQLLSSNIELIPN